MTKGELRQEIIADIKPNGRREITGAKLQKVLLDSVDVLGTETDPVFMASPAATITAQDIQDWDGKAEVSDVQAVANTAANNAQDIADLQSAYAGLTQSDIEVVASLPASGTANTIYRVAGVNTYADYMWDGTQWVLLATYNNAIDPVPTENSTNLVESGGVYDAIKTVADDVDVALDVVDKVQNVNLFDKTAATEGYVKRTDGTIYSSADYFTTDYIPIDAAGAYANFGLTGGTSRGYACYDSAKSFTHGGSNQQASYVAGDAYVRFSGANTNKDTFMVVRGTSADIPSAYVPFGYHGELKDAVVTEDAIEDDAVTTRAIADDAVTIDKVSFTMMQVDSTNLLDTASADFSDTVGDFINYNTGAAAHTSQSTVPHGRTPFIPVSKNGLYFNAFVAAGSFGGAVYDAEKNYLRENNHAYYIYQEGDAFVRWTLAAVPIAPYSPGQYMVFEGDGSELPPYDDYHAKKVISPDVLPSMDVQIEDGSIDMYKFNNDVRARIAGSGVDICIPDVIPVVVGDVLRIYYRSIVKSPNPSIWDVSAVSGVGKNYPKYYMFAPTTAGNSTVTFYVRNAERRIVAEKAVTIKAIPPMTSPLANKNILMLGASMLADGNMAYELNRRLTSTSGDGTPLNPTGLGLANISFVGRLTGSQHPEMRQEATGGWSWKDYATEGRLAVRFFVSGVNLLHIGDEYTDSNGTYTFTIAEINVTEGVGNIRCTVSTNVSIAASGTLNRIDGTGDVTINYSSWQQESRNPFWNNVTEQLDLTTYANDWCDGAIDVLLSFTAMNDFTSHTESTLPAVFEDYVKPFARAYHNAFPSGIFVLCTMYLGSPNGGMAASYGASSIWNYYIAARKVWRWAELAHEMAADDEFSSFVKVFDTNSSFDCENLYPVGEFTIDNRRTETETLQTNGVHTTLAGKQTIADAMFNAINEIMS